MVNELRNKIKQQKQTTNEKVETKMNTTTNNKTKTNNTQVMSQEQAMEESRVPSRQLNLSYRNQGDNGYDKNWFKQREGLLEVITDEFVVQDVNGSFFVDFTEENTVEPATGLLNMYINAPTQAQAEKMSTVANVNIYTIIGEIKNISIRENQYGGLSLELQSRSYEMNGQTNYINDVKLNSTTRAQILTVVDSLLTEA